MQIHPSPSPWTAEGRHARKQRPTGIVDHASERPTIQLVLRRLGSHNLSHIRIGGSGLAHKTADINAFLRGAIHRMTAQSQPATAAPVRGNK